MTEESRAAETVSYSTDRSVTVTEFKDILERSGLAERRPVGDADRLAKMLASYTFAATAWRGDRLVGISTIWTDHAFIALLADLAVDRDWQKKGIGTRLVEICRDLLGPRVTLMLLSAPGAAAYYPKIGMERFMDCFLFRRSE